MKIKVIKDAPLEIQAKAVADLLNKRITTLNVATKKAGVFCFLAAGGSALSVLDYLDVSLFGSATTIVGVLDERYSTDPKVSNFAQLTQTSFYQKLLKAGVKFIDTRVKNNETGQALAERFANELNKIVDSGLPIIATIGVGPDGHISGIMPYPEDPKRFDELFNDPSKLAIYYEATGKNPIPQRITTTLPLLRKIQYAAGRISGDIKKDALNRITADTGSLALTPARVLREMNEVNIITEIIQ